MLCMCVCVRERERERDKERAGESDTETDRETERQTIETTHGMVIDTRNHDIHTGIKMNRKDNQPGRFKKLRERERKEKMASER